jgi:hypothetical protein
MDMVNNMLIMLASGIPGLVIAGVILILMFLALIRKEAGLMVFAALLIVPFAYALGSWFGVGLIARALPLLLLGSAFAISKEDGIFSWALSAPSFGYLIYTLFKILSAGAVDISV